MNIFLFSSYRLQGEIWGWSIFFLGVTAVAFGSSYYHLEPNDARLVWDRLPVGYFYLFVFMYFFIVSAIF